MTASPASAKTGKDNGGTGNAGAGGGGDSYKVHVGIVTRGAGSDSQQATSSDVNFTPPVCWYSSMTPEQMKAEITRRFYAAGAAQSGTTYNFYNDQNNEMDKDHYHQGQDGSWWVLTWDEDQLNNGNSLCPYDQGYFWRPPGDPPQGRITPEMLAQAAYGHLKLPAKGVKLSPNPANQKVNLPTYVSFQQDAGQVSVTAQLTEPDGQVIAATVAAEPQSLKVSAGTEYATPATCTYSLSGGTLNSDGAPCNITYRKSSDGGTYPFTAAMTWEVWWTPTADVAPPGNPLAPGLSNYDQPVAVQEIQAVNR